jgi:ABC-type glycerol-3-phosphate transport system permease component
LIFSPDAEGCLWGFAVRASIPNFSVRSATLPLVLIDYKGEYFASYSMQFAAILVASLPMVVMYLFMQRTFQAGLTAGAVKG